MIFLQSILLHLSQKQKKNNKNDTHLVTNTKSEDIV